tara:strand:- start:140 stop:1333 length:1194 start_codon:yes stop_codon:yes gene_type:complete
MVISPFIFKSNKLKNLKFIDLSRQKKSRQIMGVSLGTLIDRNIKKVLKHGQYIMGPEIKELELKLKKFVGTQHCINVSSGTDALLIALMSLGVKRGDEVITTPFSFIATAEVIALLGAKPIYVDIDPKTYNIDPAKLEAKVNNKTKAIIAVSLYGQPAEFEQINQIAKKYSLPVIEDAAQSFGSTQNGIRSCNLSTIGVTSFFPSKPLGCYGDGGACFTNNDFLAEKIKRISLHGQEKRYYHTEIGLNGRLDTIQAAILLAKLKFFDSEVKARQKLGDYYSNKLNSIGIKSTPYILPKNKTVFAQYTILVNKRERFQEELRSKGIPTAVHYPTILPLQPALSLTSNLEEEKTLLKNAYFASQKVVSLPFHPWLKNSEINYIVDHIEKVVIQDSSYLI